MAHKVYIGTTPCDEPCVQTRPDGRHEKLQKLECRAYIAALTRVFGEPPADTKLIIGTQRHDLGTYWEVQCTYDANNEASRSYAYKIEDGLSAWREAQMWPPITFDDKDNAVLVLEEPELWDMASNPHCHSTKGRRDAAMATESEKREFS